MIGKYIYFFSLRDTKTDGVKKTVENILSPSMPQLCKNLDYVRGAVEFGGDFSKLRTPYLIFEEELSGYFFSVSDLLISQVVYIL